MPSVALMYAHTTPLEATSVQVIVPWRLETSMPCGNDARFTNGLAMAAEKRADNVMVCDRSLMLVSGKDIESKQRSSLLTKAP